MNSTNSTALTAIIVDDELHGRENLKKILEIYCPEIEVLGVAESVVSAKELAGRVNPDVVFLDINMPVLSGFDFLEEYTERNFLVVFVSAHEEFGIRAVKAGATDYLLKPVSIRELKQTVKKLLSIQPRTLSPEALPDPDKLVIPSSHGFIILEIDDVIRLEADGCYTTIFMVGGNNTIVSRTLKEFEDTLPKDRFFRIHKSNIINLKYIKDYSNLSGNLVTMTDGSRVELSRRKAPEFLQKIKSVLKSV